MNEMDFAGFFSFLVIVTNESILHFDSQGKTWPHVLFHRQTVDTETQKTKHKDTGKDRPEK